MLDSSVSGDGGSKETVKGVDLWTHGTPPRTGSGFTSRGTMYTTSSPMMAYDVSDQVTTVAVIKYLEE